MQIVHNLSCISTTNTPKMKSISISLVLLCILLSTFSESVSMRIEGCCKKKNIPYACKSGCNANVNITLVLNKQICVKNLDKLMVCAADKSDHRECCLKQHVPEDCSSWCLGGSIGNSNQCGADRILPYVNHITDCFLRELPGPPRDIRVDNETSDSVIISWDVPEKHAKTVTYYILVAELVQEAGEISKSSYSDHCVCLSSVFWEAVGSEMYSNKSTNATTITISNLQASTKFRLKALAGNPLGKSIETTPVFFSTTATFAAGSGTSNAIDVVAWVSSGLIPASGKQDSKGQNVIIAVGVIVVFLLSRHRNV